MIIKTVFAAVALLCAVTTASFAQSLPNYGPNAPGNGDSFGKPYSGAQPLASGRHAYAYSRHWHRRHWRRHHTVR